jgi:hypothetical protein
MPEPLLPLPEATQPHERLAFKICHLTGPVVFLFQGRADTTSKKDTDINEIALSDGCYLIGEPFLST